jgi:Tfp pilus assembly protein PilO
MNDPLRKLGWALHAVGLAVVLSSVCLAQAFVYRPLQLATGETLARRDEINRLLKDVNQLRAERDRLKQSLSEARQEEQRLLSRVPDAPHEGVFLGQVSRLAQEVDLQIRDYRPGEVRARSNYSEMEISLTCEGTYDSLCRFLDGLARLPRLAKLSLLDVTDPEGDGPYPATMKFTVYFSTNQKPAAPARSASHG